MGTEQIIAVVIFVLVLAAIISEKIHRAVAAMVGAILLVILGILDLDLCVSFIDFDTIGVLAGMMLFCGVVERSGLFEYLALKSAKIAKGRPWEIMVIFAIITAVLSAFLNNVTCVLLVGPMTLTICKILKLNPIPFFMAEILASNVGGTATLIGDPPNIMIGSAAGFGFMDFINYDAIPVIAIMVVYIFIFKFMYGRKMHATEEDMAYILTLDENETIKNRSLFIKSVVMLFVVIVGFAVLGQFGLKSGIIALSASAIMFLIAREPVEPIISNIEWPTILFFVGLFVVVGGMEHTGVIEILANGLINLTHGNMFVAMMLILWGSAIISAILDNIPFVATMIPMIVAMEGAGFDVFPLWWALSLGACLGGNGTLIGASANVVLSGISTREGYPITFMSFLKTGFPMMIVSVVVAMIYMLIRF